MNNNRSSALPSKAKKAPLTLHLTPSHSGQLNPNISFAQKKPWGTYLASVQRWQGRGRPWPQGRHQTGRKTEGGFCAGPILQGRTPAPPCAPTSVKINIKKNKNLLVRIQEGHVSGWSKQTELKCHWVSPLTRGNTVVWPPLLKPSC